MKNTLKSDERHGKREEISPESFGLSPASMDPIKTIEMEGAMFRGMVNENIRRTLFTRLFSVLVGVLLLTQGIFLIYLGIYSRGADIISASASLLIGGLFAAGGLKIIFKNVKAGNR